MLMPPKKSSSALFPVSGEYLVDAARGLFIAPGIAPLSVLTAVLPWCTATFDTGLPEIDAL
jgi:hypothetical protein